MIRIQLDGTSKRMERALLEMAAEWDEMERWLLRTFSDNEKARIAGEEKEKLLEKIREMRGTERADA